jgi:hypothetical protein
MNTDIDEAKKELVPLRTSAFILVRTSKNRTLHDHSGMDQDFSRDIQVDTVFFRIETGIGCVAIVIRPC